MSVARAEVCQIVHPDQLADSPFYHKRDSLNGRRDRTLEPTIPEEVVDAIIGHAEAN
jgi:hypothetical protein